MSSKASRYTPTNSLLTSPSEPLRRAEKPTTCNDPAQNSAKSSSVAANVGVATLPGIGMRRSP